MTKYVSLTVMVCIYIAHLLLEIVYAAAAMADTRALLSKGDTSMLKSQVSTRHSLPQFCVDIYSCTS